MNRHVQLFKQSNVPQAEATRRLVVGVASVGMRELAASAGHSACPLASPPPLPLSRNESDSPPYNKDDCNTSYLILKATQRPVGTRSCHWKFIVLRRETTVCFKIFTRSPITISSYHPNYKTLGFETASPNSFFT